MRGMLNVRPLLVLASVMAVPPVVAQALPASVIACADEADVLKRLSCYDREVARYRTHPAASTAVPPGPAGAGAPSPATSGATPPRSASQATAKSPGVSAPATASASPQDLRAEFGMNGELKRKEQGPGAAEPVKLEKLTARIASLSYKPHGESILTLDDGQIWEEAENASHVPYHVGDEVTIKRGVLGAFYLSTEAVRGMRVKRVH